MTISRWILIRMRNVSNKSCRENQNAHFMFNNFFSRKSCCLWHNEEEYGGAGQATADNTIRRMRFACWITKATDTHTHKICNAYCFSTATMVTRTRLNITLYVRCLYLLYFAMTNVRMITVRIVFPIFIQRTHFLHILEKQSLPPPSVSHTVATIRRNFIYVIAFSAEAAK
jgi:hypothetical protein